MKTDSDHQGPLVLLDTNFLLLPFQRRIDIFEEIPQVVGRSVKFLVLPQIFDELLWLTKKGSSKEVRAAQSAIQALDHFGVVVPDLPGAIRRLDADSALLQYAQQMGAIVATNDRELRLKLIAQGSRVIYLRKLAVLALTE